MPDPGFTRPDLCSIRAAAGQAEPAETARGGLTADGHLPAGDYPSAPLATGIDRAIRLSTAAAVLAVAGIAASPTGTPTQSSGPTARPGSPPGSSPQPSTASSTPARWWSCTRHGTGYRYPPSPAGCSRWESPLPSRRTWHRAGRTVPSGRWSRPGRRPVSWAHTNFWSGSSAPPGRQNVGRRQRTSALVRPAVLRCVLSWPQPLTASAPEGASAARQARRGGPRVRALGSRPSPPAGSVTMRRLRPAPAMTRRWPRTGSACRPATRCQNAGSPRCSGVHPAAGREPESPIHGKHRRSQTRRVPRSRLTRKQGPSAVSPERDLTAPGRSAIGAWRSATSAPLGEPGCHEGERSGLAGHPRRGIRGRSGSSRDPGPGVAFDAGNTVELTAGNGDRIQLFGPGQRYFEFYRSHGDSIVPLLEADDLDQARPSWPAAAPGYSASRSQTAPGPVSPSGRPTGTSTAWAPAWRSWQARRLWSNALDMRHERALFVRGSMYKYSDWAAAC